MDIMDIMNFARVTPPWMDQSFFEKVIRIREYDSKAVVEAFDVSAGSKPGDNFASALYRGVITYRSKFTKNVPKMLSLIIKTQIVMGVSESQLDFLKDSPLFKSEIEMYGKVLPAIQSLWLSVGDKDLLCPK